MHDADAVGPDVTGAPVQEPVAGVQEPVAGVQEPVAGVQEPVAGVQEPVAGVQEPVAGVQEPPVIETRAAGHGRPARPGEGRTSGRKGSYQRGSGGLDFHF